jgi:hypothetical protein
MRETTEVVTIRIHPQAYRVISKTARARLQTIGGLVRRIVEEWAMVQKGGDTSATEPERKN